MIFQASHIPLSIEQQHHIINTHADLLAALEDLLIYCEADNDIRVHMYPQSLDNARRVIARAKGAS